MVTVKEDVERKIQKAENWEKMNPGLSWVNDVSSENEEKIYITKELLDSPPFRSLSAVGYLVYMDFLGKRVMKPCGTTRSNGRKNSKKKWAFVNNGQLQYPYSEAVENGISRVRFRNAIDELQRKGFIDITHLGVGGRKPTNGTGDSTLYLLDDRWREYDATTGKATVPPRKPRKKDLRMDRGFQKYWADKKQTVGIENDTS